MRPVRLLALAVVLAALAPGRADAALSVASVAASPSTTQAGAHPDLALTISLGGAQDNIRDLTIHLPKGLVGNPQAVGTCTQAQFAADGCPADSQVGTTSIDATVTQTVLVVPVTVDQDVAGQVFNLAPNAGEPARLSRRLSSCFASSTTRDRGSARTRSKSRSSC